MSRNGSGVYSLPAGNPVVTGTTISSSWANTTLSDIATALTGSVAADGQTAMTGNLQMGNNKVTGLANGSASTDALAFGQIAAGTLAGAFTTLSASGAFSANGGATLGDASGDALTINSSAVSIPNGLNFDSNTFVIDAANNRVGVGTASPQERLDINGNIQVGYTASGQYVDVYNGDTTNYQRLRLSMSGNNAFITTRRSGGTVPQMLFGIDNSEVMRIDSSGNVGIGTSSPNATLNINKPNTANGTVFLNGATLGPDFMRIKNTGGDGVFGVEANTGSALVTGSTAYATVLYTVGSTPLQFGTNSNIRATIDTSGNLLVGTTSTNSYDIGHRLFPNGIFNATTDGNTSNLVLRKQVNNGSAASFVAGTTGNIVGGIVINASSTSFNTSSDYRLKENVAPMTGALATVQALKPCTYNWKVDGSSGQGFIAHELQEVVPDCVTGEKDAVDEEGNPQYQGIDTSFLVATLTAAIQEQQEIITDLKARIETLENK